MSFRLNSRASHVVGLNNLRSLLPKWGVYLGYALVLASFFLPARASALQLSDLRTAIRVRIKDASASRQRYSDTQLNGIINQSQRDIINYALPVHKNTSISLSVGTTYYTIPSDVIQLERVTFKNQFIPEQTLTSLDSAANYAAWEQAGGTPSQYFQDPSRSTQIGIYPFPSTTTATGTLKVIYYAQGTDLVNDTDVPFNSEVRYYPYHDLIIYDVCYKINLIEGFADRAGEYRGFYELRLKNMMDYIGARPNYKPGFAGPNPR